MLQSRSPSATFKSKALVKLQFIQLCYRLSPHRLPGGARGKEPTRQYRRLQKGGFNPWVRKILWRRAQQPTPVFLPGESHGQRTLEGYSPQGHRDLNMSEVTQQQQQHICVHVYIYTNVFDLLCACIFVLCELSVSLLDQEILHQTIPSILQQGRPSIVIGETESLLLGIG